MFKPGDTVMFEPNHFDPAFWDNLSNKNKSKYYGCFYEPEQQKRKLFTFITYHSPQEGHCVLMDMDDGKLLPMCHESDFRLAKDNEC